MKKKKRNKGTIVSFTIAVAVPETFDIYVSKRRRMWYSAAYLTAFGAFALLSLLTSMPVFAIVGGAILLVASHAMLALYEADEVSVDGERVLIKKWNRAAVEYSIREIASIQLQPCYWLYGDYICLIDLDGVMLCRLAPCLINLSTLYAVLNHYDSDILL